MKRLILLNFISAFLWLAAMLAFQKYESGWLMLVSSGLMLFVPALGLWNIISVFSLWKRGSFRALYPVLTFLLALVIGFLGARFGTRVMLEGTPCIPESFLTQQTKNDLENAASKALGKSFKNIFPNDAQMIAGHPQKDVPPEIIKTLQKYGFQSAEIDDAESIVTFNYRHMRAIYSYTYATDKLAPLGSRPPIISEADMEDWSELIRIAKQGDHASNEEARRIVFNPDIVYPYLRQELGQAQLDNFKGYTSARDISANQRQSVLSALNRQWIPSNRLVENSSVFYDSNHMLHIGGSRMDAFWVVFLLRKLLADGTLVYASDNAHLRIKANLSASDQNRIAWLHVGLMNFVYGNLFKKDEHFDDKVLGDGWYFTVR